MAKKVMDWGFFFCILTPSSDLTSKAGKGFVPDVHESLDHHAFEPSPEAADTVEGLGQLGVVVHRARRGQVGRAEAAQEQGQEKVQHLTRNHVILTGTKRLVEKC